MAGRNIPILAGWALLGLLASPVAVAATEAVDLELVIATDVSYSIDGEEAELQRQGVAAAFRGKWLIKAIRSGFLRRIAVAYLDYSSRSFNNIMVDWRIIEDAKSANDFADALLEAPPTYGRRTSISDAVEMAAHMIETNKFDGTRRVIDVSGDGPNNLGRFVDHVRYEVADRRITINGLPIVNENDRFNSRFYLAYLDDYYRGCVIGGPGAFLVVARDFKDFARAIRRKLILEIAGRTPPPGTGVILASSHSPPDRRGTGYVYKQGCDIGERMRQRRWSGDDDS